MKKLIYLLASLLAVFVMSSCEKEDAGGTATEALAGEWYVTADAVDDNGNVVYSDLFGLGKFHLLTFNTSSNVSNQMYVSDEGNFWGFKVLSNCDLNAMTFSTSGAVQSIGADTCNVTITGGKILPKAGKQNNGSVADSIVFYVTFSDDPYPAAYGYSKYKISGVRYSGLTEND